MSVALHVGSFSFGCVVRFFSCSSSSSSVVAFVFVVSQSLFDPTLNERRRLLQIIRFFTVTVNGKTCLVSLLSVLVRFVQIIEVLVHLTLEEMCGR